jgi:superfamily II DNA/RNA helicase
LALIDKLSTNPILKKNKLVIFTESKETAEYLEKNLEDKFPKQTLCFTGLSSEIIREQILENFDAKARFPKDDYRILVSTEILAEGVNLHRSNVVINYDIPWNPTRMMQRVGRINRVDTKFDKIYTFNFFPTEQANNQIKLREAAETKINAFLTLLGGDAYLLTENEPIGSHELFNRLTSAKFITGEDGDEESELKYLQVIKNLRDKDPDIFEKIKRLPKKSRTARTDKNYSDHLLTYFRQGRIQKFFLVKSNDEPQELDFISAAKILEVAQKTKQQKIDKKFYDLLDKNKRAFFFATAEELPNVKIKGGRDSATQILRILKATMKDRRQFTEDQELYLKKVMTQIEEGGLPKQTTKITLQILNEEMKKNSIPTPLKILSILETNIPARLLESHFARSENQVINKREVVLSEYLNK